MTFDLPDRMSPVALSRDLLILSNEYFRDHDEFLIVAQAIIPSYDPATPQHREMHWHQREISTECERTYFDVMADLAVYIDLENIM